MDNPAPFTILRTGRPANDERSMSSSDSAYGSATEGSPAATHDISRVSYHVKHIDSFARALEDSASRAFPNRGRSGPRYSKVQALLLHWKSDDLFVLPELEDLGKCLREHYNFATDIFSIPSENSHLELMLKIGDTVKQHESEDTLFIVYYGGHAKIDEARQSTWCANRLPGSPWLQWSAIQTLLERSISDVMILLDCCAGAASATFPTGQSITETISASSWDAIAPDPGRYSFTNALIEVLDEWRHRTFSAAMLHAEILARLKHPRPILINGKHFEARSTPVHFMMTSNHRAPSIEICRLVPRKQRPPLPSPSPSPNSELVFWNQPSHTPHPMMIEGRNPVQEYPFARDLQIPAASEPNENEPHVLLSLALEDDQQLDLNDWENWLAAFPAIAKHVKVQGVFKSHSTLLLLSLPVMVWDFLPDDPACSFVAFIRSNNLLRAQKPGAAPEAARAPAASEAPGPAVQPALHSPCSTHAARPARPPSLSSRLGDDAESCLSGTTYGPAESLRAARRDTWEFRFGQSQPAAGVPWLDSLNDMSPGSHAGCLSTSPLSLQGPLGGPGPQHAPGSLGDVPSSTSLRTADRRRLGPLAHTAQGGADSPVPAEGISRMMILNQTRASKTSVFQPDQDVPEGQPMAPHVVRRLEDYFAKVPDPSVAVVEHLASNLGVEAFDVHAWFHHRREQERMKANLQNLKIESRSSQAQEGAQMILPGHLNKLLEIYPSKGVLLVDLRSTTDFERSHIHDAINLRAPLSFVENTSLEMIEDTFMDDQSRRSFSKWSQFKCLVFYDRVIEFTWECPVAKALYAKFRRKGWQGQCFILKGHYREFSASFDKHISGAKMTSEAKEYIDSLRQQPSPTEEEARRRDEEYHEWLSAFASQHRTSTTDLIPSRKFTRKAAVGQHQRELEVEFEARFPALYKKARSMCPAADLDDLLTPPPGSPPPPFPSEPHRSRPFKDVDWAGTSRDDGDDFSLRKAPLVGPLASGLDKIREADSLPRSDSNTSFQGYHEDYPVKGLRDVCADEYENDYDEIDPASEGLGNDPGFQKAGVPSALETETGTGTRAHGKGGDDSLKRAAKKRSQLWERLRGVNR